MKIKRIVLDMDDVLNHFSIDVLKFFGVTSMTYNKWPIECSWNLRCVLSTLTKTPEYEIKEFWDRVPRHVWSNLTPSPELDEILEWGVSKVGRDNILIGTSPTKCPECMAGKYDWMRDNLPDWMQRQYAITPRKWWFAREDTLLIDDMEHNCTAMREDGGHAITFPRPWNSNCMGDIMTTLDTEFEEIENADYQAMAER